MYAMSISFKVCALVLSLPISMVFMACADAEDWSPPTDIEADAAAPLIAETRADDTVIASDDVQIVEPEASAGCAKVGDPVLLSAVVKETTAKGLTWYFHSDQAGCQPVVLAALNADAPSTWANPGFLWSTDCVQDIPNECGLGQGRIVAEVTNSAETRLVAGVPFCLTVTNRP